MLKNRLLDKKYIVKKTDDKKYIYLYLSKGNKKAPLKYSFTDVCACAIDSQKPTIIISRKISKSERRYFDNMIIAHQLANKVFLTMVKGLDDVYTKIELNKK